MSRILFTLTPVTGHVRPALPLARALVEEGHEVVVYTGTQVRARRSPRPAPSTRRSCRAATSTTRTSTPGRWRRAHRARASSGCSGTCGTTSSARSRASWPTSTTSSPPSVPTSSSWTTGSSRAGAIAARRHDLPSRALLGLAAGHLEQGHRAVRPGPAAAADRARRPALRGARLVHREGACSGTSQKAARARWSPTPACRCPTASSSTGCRRPPRGCCTRRCPSFEYPRSDLPEHVELVGPFLPAGVDRFEPPGVVGRRAGGARDGSCRSCSSRRARSRPTPSGCSGRRSTASRTRTCWWWRPPSPRTSGSGERARAASVRAVRPPAAARRRAGDERRVRRGAAGARARGARASWRAGPRTRPRSVRGSCVVRRRSRRCVRTRSRTATTSQDVRDGVRTVLDNPSFARAGRRSSPPSTRSTTASRARSSVVHAGRGPAATRASGVGGPTASRLGVVARRGVRSRVASVRSSALHGRGRRAAPEALEIAGVAGARPDQLETIEVKSAVETLDAHQGQADRRGAVRRAQAEHRRTPTSTSRSRCTVPGFRKGKVPPRIIDQRVGRAAVIEHAVNEGLSGFYAEAVRENKLRPLGQPEVEVTEVPGLTAAPTAGTALHRRGRRPPRDHAPRPRRPSTVTVDDVEVTDEDVARAPRRAARALRHAGRRRPPGRRGRLRRHRPRAPTIDDEEVDTRHRRQLPDRLGQHARGPRRGAHRPVRRRDHDVRDRRSPVATTPARPPR